MAIFIKATLKKLDDQAKIDKYRVAANSTEYYSIIRINLPKNHHFKIPDDISIYKQTLSFFQSGQLYANLIYDIYLHK